MSSIAEDASGALWFGTADGLIRKSQDGMKLFTQSDGLPSSAILEVAAGAKQTLVALTASGLAQLDGGVFRAMKTLGHVRRIQAQPDGSVWVFEDTGIERVRNGALEKQVLSSSGDSTVLGVQQGTAGELWEWSNGEVVRVAAGHRRAWRTGVELQGSRVQALCVDRSGVAWVGTNRGLLTIEPGEESEAHPVDGFQSQSILAIREDREGNYWIGTEGDGLHALRPRKFAADPASAFEAVTAVVQASDGVVWFGTRDGGVKRIAGTKAETPVRAEALTSPVVLSLAAGEHGDVWIGTPDGLNHLDHGQIHQWTSADGLPDDFVRSLATDAVGGVWAGTRRGLVHLSRDGGVQVLTTVDGLPSDSIGELVGITERRSGDVNVSDAGLWVGTASGLANVRQGGVRTFEKKGRTAATVTAMAVDREGKLWLGLHSSGLHTLQSGVLQQIRSAALPPEIEALQADTAGYLWLRSRQGVYRVQITELKTCVAGKASCELHVQQFGTADGLPSDEVSTGAGQPSFAVSSDGTMWLTTRKGLALARAERLPFNAVSPPAVIERFLVDGSKVADLNAVGYGHHRYNMEYAGLTYTMPSRTHYRYQLQGYDRDWVDAGTRRSAYYTGLAPGAYRFVVFAQNADGVWSRQPAELSFRIVPPLYRRWWAYCLEVLAAGLLFFLVVRLRLRAEQKRFAIVLNERNRVAREIHDTLAQDLVSVSLHLEIAASMVKARKLDAAAEQLQQTRGLVKQGLASARQSIWSLRANTAQNSLPSRLTSSVDRFRTKIAAIHLAIGGAYREVQHEIEDQVMRIADEVLENVRRHASAEEVWVELAYESDRLVLSVKDDGKGFELEEAQAMTGHYGLKGIYERAETIGGQITITSGPGEGTSVVVRVPLPRPKS